MNVATTRRDISAAQRLVHEAYQRAGLTTRPVSGEVLVDKRCGVVTYTATLVLDGPDGLPIDAVFADVVGGLPGRAEWCCLAGQPGQPFAAMTGLREFAIERARTKGVQTMLVATHPRHARFYRRLFGASVLGGERPYGAVGGAPAVALGLGL